jgi:hypothetical protein
LPAKKKREQVAREREKKGGQPESGCGGAAEPPAASQDDALEPTLTALTARPPDQSFLKKRVGGLLLKLKPQK